MNEPVDKTPPMPETFDLAELKDIFSAEEIAAMAEGDDPIVKLPDPKNPEPATETLADQDAEAIAAAQAAAEAAKQAQQPPAEQQQKPQEPIQADVPDTTQAQEILDAHDAKLEAIQDKYDAGDLTRAEMKAEVARLSDERAQAVSTISRATEIIEQNKQSAEQLWLNSLDAFKAAGNEVLWSPDHLKGFDASLRRVTNPAIHPEFQGKPFDFLIQTAAKLYASQHEALTSQKLDLGGIAQPKQQKAEVKRDQRPDAPQLLGGLNGDGGLAVDDGTFAAIDRTSENDPFAAEAMMQRLSPAQLDAYLRNV